ncbi:hypothetical protein [Blastopirellula marina]|uniref:DUF2384 domain-containing protein n=1 Tax=Blastopirellula marina TaxID=124 RepID=A0A2S8GSK6_9BACT|nr:hypothetical protein [Blastopirellula marina]PQO47410.1 hypothetical protein C5Y93_05030 [Blastopirellula marina]
MKESEIEDLIDIAEKAFWQVIAEQNPQCTTGDLSPITKLRLRQVASESVKEWLHLNAPLPA